jgi:hypothetical protein
VSAACKSCGARVLWVQLLPRGTTAPLDDKPSTAGNVRLSKGGTVAKVLNKTELAAARRNSEQLYTSHFATCSNAASHRKGPTS